MYMTMHGHLTSGTGDSGYLTSDRLVHLKVCVINVSYSLLQNNNVNQH